MTGVGASVALDQSPIATPVAVNPQSSYQVMISETTIPASLATLLSAEHAGMVYDSDENLRAVACGNIGGALMGDTLVVGLAEMGAPSHTGFALFRPDGDQTEVTILFGHGLSPISAAQGTADCFLVRLRGVVAPDLLEVVDVERALHLAAVVAGGALDLDRAGVADRRLTAVGDHALCSLDRVTT